MKTILKFALLLICTLLAHQKVFAQCPLDIQIEELSCSTYVFTAPNERYRTGTWAVDGDPVLMDSKSYTFEASVSGTYTICGSYEAPDCQEPVQNCITVLILADCFDAVGVWPGDANNNGIVNTVDFLYTIWALGESGPARSVISTAWEAMDLPEDWDNAFPNQSEELATFYADANGDGLVNPLDTGAIMDNFGLTHGTVLPNDFAVADTGEGPILELIAEVDEPAPGTAFNIDLHLGNEDFIVEAFYGMAIELSYTLAGSPEETRPVFDFQMEEDSWLNSDDSPIFQYVRHEPNANKFHIALSRTNGTGPVNMAGKIASLSVIIEDIVLGLDSDIFHIEVENVRLIDANFFTYPVVYSETDVFISRNGQGACESFFEVDFTDCTNASFRDLSPTLPDETIMTWAWDFGDGTMATDQNPTHTYAMSGTYTTCLTTTTANNCVSTYCLDMVVNCDSTCPLVVEVEQDSCYSYDFRVLESASEDVLWTVNGIFNQVTSGNFNFTADEPGTYEICGSYETPDCPINNFFCQTIVVEQDCFIEEICDFDIYVQEFDCSNYVIYNAQDYENVNWYVNGELFYQGEATDFAPSASGIYEICGEWMSDECSSGATACTIINIPEDCFPIEPVLTFQLQSSSGSTGSTILVPVTVENFTDIASFSFTLQTALQPSVLDFTGIVDGALSGISANPVNDETLLIIWNDLTASGQTFEDGAILFYVEMALEGNPDDCTEVLFENEPLNIAAIQIVSDVPNSITPSTIGSVVCINNGLTKSGQITIETGDPVADVLVFCEDNPTLTDDNGYFSFTDLDMGGSYNLSPFRNDNHRNGIDIIDAFLILSHINNNNLDSPYKIIAADVNNDHIINMTDFNQTRDLLLLLFDEFPASSSWEFVVKDYIFPMPTNPFLEAYPELIQFPNLMTDATDQDFIAIKKGNLDLSAPELRSSNDLVWAIEEVDLIENETIRVPVLAKDFARLSGYQAQINFSNTHLEFLNVETAALSDVSFGQELIHEGILMTNWLDLTAHPSGYSVEDNTVLFTLNFRAKTSGAILSDLLSVEHDLQASFAFDSNFERLNISLEFDGEAVSVPTFESADFEVATARPNPFNTETRIALRLPSAAEVRCTVLDVSGKVVYQQAVDFAAGQQEWLLEKAVLPHHGLYFYRLDSAWGTRVGRLLFEE